MTRRSSLRYRLLAPLLYLAALLLLLEDWVWDTGARLAAWLAGWPPLRRLETHLAALPPWAALTAFVLPALLLLPVKLLALFAIARGHPAYGVAVFVAAKLGGAALVARMYLLTRPQLLSLAWFARCHNAFLALKDRLLARLRDSSVYRRSRRIAHRMRRAARQLADRLFASGRHASHGGRVLRRYVARWRARRRKPSEKHP